MTKKTILPGIIFTILIAILSFYIKDLSFASKLHLSSLVIAIIGGIILNNIFNLPTQLNSGITYSTKKILKLGIILLGFRLNLAQVAGIGAKGLIIVLSASTITIITISWLGKIFKVNDNLSFLIGTGTSICGTSAIAAIAPVLIDKDGSIEDSTAFAISTITLFGTLAMFLYPLILKLFNLDFLIYSIWSGSSIHGVGQAVAAGFAAGEKAGQFTTLIKLTRVLLIIPLVLFLSFKKSNFYKKEKNPQTNQAFVQSEQLAIPWFVFGFLAVILINSLQILPTTVVSNIITIDKFILTIAMAGIGLKTSFSSIKKTGVKPFYLGLTAWIIISSISFILAQLIFN